MPSHPDRKRLKNLATPQVCGGDLFRRGGTRDVLQMLSSQRITEIPNFAFLHQRLLTDYRLKVDLLHLESDRITETLSPVNTDKCVNRSFFLNALTFNLCSQECESSVTEAAAAEPIFSSELVNMCLNLLVTNTIGIKSESYRVSWGFHTISQLFFLHLVLLLPSASNPCETNDGRGPCSHLCLINYNRTASCTCPHLMKLSPNKQSCFGRPETTSLFPSFSRPKHVNNT